MDKTFDVIALGEGMVEFNQTRAGEPTYLQGFGGDTSNAIIAAARQGAAVAYLSAVGQDGFGDLLLQLWQREGVNIEGVMRSAQAPTGIYFVQHDAQGHHFSYRRKGSAAACMTPDQLPAPLLAQTRYLHVSGISQAISTQARACVSRAVSLVRDAAGQVAYDPNLRLSLWSVQEAHEAMLEILPFTDEFLPGTDEMAQLTGITDPEQQIHWAHARGARHVVLKMGSQGVWVSDGQRLERMAAHKVQAVDATGAGDCFDGNYLASRARGESVFASARWAVAAAALSTLGYGAVAPLPRREQVKAQLDQQPG